MKKIKAGFMAFFLILFFKIGPKIFTLLVKLVKGLKIGKGALAATSFASYAYLFTWQFACIIMIFLFIHESGHVWAMRRCGIKTKGFYFIPFFGGAAVADEEFPSRGAEAFVAIMGPIWGFALVGITSVIYFMTKNPLFAAASSWMALVNLFNLLPINPLDGGRILKSAAFSINSLAGIIFLGVGIVLATALAFYARLGLLVFLLVIGAIELVFEYKKYKRTLAYQRAYHEISSIEYFSSVTIPNIKIMPSMKGASIAMSIAGYFVLGGVLYYFMTLMNHVPGASAALELLRG